MFGTGAKSAVAWLFPGQGSQFLGMGQDLYAEIPLVKARIDWVSEYAGIDLPGLMFGKDPAVLTSTELAQITVFTLSTALAAHLMECGVQPCAVAGHSLGEFSALVAAGALDWKDGVELVWARGTAMAAASASRPGAMAAIAGLSLPVVQQLCEDASAVGQVVGANLNSPSQFVVSGDVAAVEHVMAQAKTAGLVKVDRLNVAGAFHSPLMAPAQCELVPALSSVSLGAGQTTLVSSITGEPVSDFDEYRAALCGQITSPVRWSDTVAQLKALGVTTLAEVGPGHVLSGLTRQCDRSLTIYTVNSVASCESFVRRHSVLAEA